MISSPILISSILWFSLIPMVKYDWEKERIGKRIKKNIIFKFIANYLSSLLGVNFQKILLPAEIVPEIPLVALTPVS